MIDVRDRGELDERIEQLSAHDRQFATARPLPAVIESMSEPGLALAEIIDRCLAGYADRDALAARSRQLVQDPRTGKFSTGLLDSFQAISYRELRSRIDLLSRSLHAAGLRSGDFLAVFGFTSIDYTVVDLAAARMGAVTVALQTSSTAKQIAPILQEIAPRVLAVSIEDLETAAAVVPELGSLEQILVFDYSAELEEDRQRLDAAARGLREAAPRVKVRTLDQELESGQDLPELPLFVPEAGQDPMSCLIYTSGSTGTPKGAIYTQSMVARLWRRGFFGTEERIPALHYQNMPMSHMMGRAWLVSTIASGGVAYFAAKSDMSTLFEDLSLVRPTSLCLVPRVCEVVFQRFHSELSRPAGSESDGSPVDSGQREAEVMTELREQLFGGRVLSAVCGSAPLSPEIRSFIESCLRLHLRDGYGATETGGGVLADGKIIRPTVIDYKLVDVPELGYFSTDKPNPRGELYVKTETQIPGYYRRPELNSEVFDEQGFYKTGDVMALVGPDELVYVDRSKNVLKLSQGEFVAVANIEASLASSPLVKQIYVYGSSAQSFLLAVVVPNLEAIGAQDPRSAITASIQKIAAESGLHAYEIPRDFILERTPFSQENGLLSGLGKLLRPALKAHYGDQLDAVYRDIEDKRLSQVDELRARRDAVPLLETVRRAAQLTLGVDLTALTADSNFGDLGGDSLAAFSFASMLENIFQIDVPIQTTNSPTASLGSIADYIERERSAVSDRASFASVHGADSEVIRASDLSLAKFIDGRTLAQAATLPDAKPEPKTVLLTGANGYLGRFVCLAWLERLAETGGTLVCIARGSDDQAARSRVAEAFEGPDAQLTARFQELAEKHLEVLAGDLGEPNFGLADATWLRLASTVDRIVHVAALVNHVLPYRQLFTANVVGTAEIIKLAITTTRKPVSYVSSVAVAVLPDGGLVDELVDIREINPVRPIDGSYANGYGNSKWAGEVLLREAHDLTGLPVAVFRSDMILAHSRYAGQLNLPDMFTRLLLSIAATGLAPRSFYRLDAQGRPQRAHYDGLPVDFTAEAITELGLRANSGYHTFNVLNGHDDGVSQDVFVDWIEAAGVPLARVADYREWLTRFEDAMKALPTEQRRQSVLPLLQAFAQPGSPSDGESSANRQFRAAVKAAGVGVEQDVPHLDEALIRKYLSDLRRFGLLAGDPDSMEPAESAGEFAAAQA